MIVLGDILFYSFFVWSPDWFCIKILRIHNLQIIGPSLPDFNISKTLLCPVLILHLQYSQLLFFTSDSNGFNLGMQILLEMVNLDLKKHR